MSDLKTESIGNRNLLSALAAAGRVSARSLAVGALLLTLAGSASADVFQFNDASVSNTRTEGGPSLTLTVVRSGSNAGSASISYALTGTASNASDYTITPPSPVVFANGVFSQTITLTFPEDIVTEPTETLVVTLTGSNRGVDSIGANNTATVTILDNDGPELEINNVALTEGNSGTVVMAFTVQLSETSTQDVMVNYATQNDTAVAPGDYAATSGTLTIPAGQQLGIINVSIMSNTIDQIDRSFFVNLTNPVNATILIGQGVGTILDDDGPTVSVGDASLIEGNSGTANMTFTVSLSAPSPQQITVQYATVDDTANAGTDYQFRNGMLTFAPGVTTQTILVPIIGDTMVEADEQFFVNLFLIDEAFPGDVQGVGTIINDDVAGMTVTAAPDLETTEAGGTATFSIALTSTPSADVIISITSSDLTEGTVSHSSLTFTPANALTPQVVTITGVDDPIRDGDIAYTIITGNTQSTDPNYDGLTVADVAVTNLDDEVDPEVSLSLADSPMPENGGTATVTATLSHESAVDVTVALGFTGTATFDTDYGVSSGSIVIPAGSLTGSITITAIDDLLDEPDETVIVDITSVINGTEATPQQVIAVITDDDDEPSVQFAVGSSSGGEGDTPAQLTVTLSAASGRTVTVNYSATGGSATGGGVDYTLAAGMLTFAPGVTSQTINIAIVDDGIDEAAETVEVTLASPVNATLGTPVLHIYTIEDNDAAPAVGFTAASSSGDESVTPAQLEVTLSSASGQTVTVNYAVTGGTALGGGVDYTLAAGTLTFTPGQTSQTIDIAIVDDLIDELNETIIVALSGEMNATLGTSVHTYTILDNDDPPVLSIGDASTTEGGNLVFTVTLTGATSQVVTVGYATANNTAVEPGDYTSAAATLTFTPGDPLTQTITVGTIDDSIDEPTETMFVNLSGATNASIGDAQGVGTILDNDDAPVLSIGDASTTEGGDLVFTVTLTGATSQVVTVGYATANNTAVEPGDYTSAAATLTFTPGDPLTQTITVGTIDDSIDEPTETMFVNLSGATNASIGDAQGVGTILDNDVAPVLSIGDASTTEGGDLVFTVTLTGATSQTVTVDYATANNTAVAPGDYTSGTGTLTFTPADPLTQTITVGTIDDSIDEPTETMFVNLSGASNATVSDGQGVGTILDNDVAPVLSIGDASTTEGGDLVFTVTLTGATSQVVTVGYATANNTAVEPDDYTSAAATLTFTPGDPLTQTITIGTIDDSIDEPTETMFVNLSGASNATIADGQGVGTILDNDDAPVLSINDVTVTEGGSAEFTVTLTGGTSQTVTVDFATANGTAVVVDDYVANSGTLTFNAGVTTQTVTVVTVDDSINEPSETFFVNLSNASNASIGDGQGQGTITDNDTAPAVGFAVASSSGLESVTPAQLQVNLSSESAQTVTVNYAVTGGTALGGGVDYTLAAGTLTFTPGQTSQTIDIAIIDDLLDELDETIIVTLSGETNATLGTSAHIYTILDNDDAPTLSIGDASTTEGGNLVFTVTLTGATSQVVTVGYATADNTAVEPDDYTSAAATLTFTPGDPLTQTITIGTIDDSIDEPTETMFVNLSGASNATIADGQGVGTILDNDDAPVLSINDVTVTEGGSAEFTVTLTGGTSQTVTVDFATANGTAVVVDDYVANSGTLTFNAGVTTQTITVVTVDDAINEPSETYFVNLSNASNATIGDGQGEGTITDNDGVPSVTLSLDGSPFAENAGVATVTATLSALSGQDVTVNLGLSGTATQNVDYTPSALSIVISAGNTSGSITLTGINDLLDELDEAVIVDITSVTNGTESGTQQVTAVITDDDDAPTVTLSQSGSPIAENGGVATVTATLSAASGLDATVNLSFSGTAGASDYTASGSIISIPAGSLTGSITITGTDDSIDEPDETVVVDIASAVNATEGTPSQATVTITDDDDAPVVSFTAANQSVSEGVGTVTVTAQLSAVSGQAVTVPYTVTGTAENPADHDLAAGIISIPAGSLTGSVTFNVVDDSTNEPAETVILTIGVPTNASAGTPGVHTVTINDNDGVPDVTLSATPLTIAEAAGSSTVTATLSAISGLDVTVNLGFTGTAGFGTDYSASATSIVIPAGSLSAGMTVTAIQDAIDEVNETIIIDINSVTNGAESGELEQQVTIEIIDDDAAPAVAFSTATQSVNEGVGLVTVTAVLDAVSSLEVSVPFTVGGTATAGLDHDLVAGSITIPAGSLSGSVTFNVVDDSLDEPDETVVVTMGSPTNATTGTPSVQTITITDNDDAPVVSFTAAGQSVSEGVGTVTVTAQLSVVSGQAVTVPYTVTGTAENPADHDLADGSIPIPAGSLTGSVTFNVVDDSTNEPAETVVLTMGVPTNASAGTPGVHTVTINDNDGVPDVTLSATPLTIAEAAGISTVTATLSAISGLDVTVNLAFTGTAGFGTDYGASASSIVIPAGSLSAGMTVTAVQDAIDEVNETIVIDIDNVTNGNELGEQQVTLEIIDDDAPPAVAFSAAAQSVDEGVGSVTVTAVLDAVSSLEVTVPFTVSGTATAGLDHDLIAGSITITPGSLNGSITFNVVDDSLDEPDETVIVTMGSPTNATPGTPSVQTITITDNDAPPTVTLGLAGSPLAEDGGVATVTATLSAVSSFDVTVNLAVSGTATLATDYNVSTQTIVIAAGDTSGAMTITAIPDDVNEGDETVIVDIDTVVNGTESGVQQVTATITDDDGMPALSISDATLVEGDSGSAMMQFTVTLSGASSQDVTVGFQTADATATAGADYTAASGTLTIDAGLLSGTVDVAVLGDELAEGDETFTVTLSGAVNATIADETAVGTITDDDAAPVAVNDGFSVAEDATLTVAAPGVLGNDTDGDGDTLSAALVSDVASGLLTLNPDGSFEYTPNPDFNGTDSFTYTATDGFNTSAAATVTITVDPVNDVPVANDDAYTSDEDVVLTVPAPGVLGNDTDVDNDTLTVSLVTGPDAAEGALVLNGDGSFEFTPVQDFNGTVTFTYLVNDGTVDSNTATVTLTIDAVNDDPVAAAGTAVTDEDTAVDTDVLAFVTDVDGDTLTVTGSTDGANGTVSCTTAGICTYTPDADFNGTDSYTYTVDDGNGGTVTETVTVTVNAVNDVPAATADSYTTDENVALSVAAPGVLANDADVDGDPLTAVKLSDPANGTVTLNADGSFIYTPSPNFFGTDSFTYAANDGSVNSNEVTVSLTVISADDDPSLSSVTPGSICEGGPEFTLTVTGENFVAGSTVGWNGSPRATTFVSATQLTAVIAESDIASAGTAAVTVTNPAGGGSSLVMNFTIGEDTVAPTVTAPAQIFILQTECQAGEGGITTATSTLLADFLASATAADACSTEVDQLAPQLNGVDVDASTFLGGGDNLITFRFVDNAGNVGSADANVRVVLYGDMNEDGSVDATDLVIMANHLVGNIPMGTAPFTAPMQLIDLDANSSLDAVDLVTMAHYLVGNISCLPYASGQ